LGWSLGWAVAASATPALASSPPRGSRKRATTALLRSADPGAGHHGGGDGAPWSGRPEGGPDIVVGCGPACVWVAAKARLDRTNTK